MARTDLKDAVERVRLVSEGMGARELLTDDSLSKVSIVGAGMLDAPGYASRMFRALAKANINIDMITTTEIRITCIIVESSVEDAVRVLHEAFQLEKP